MEIAGGEITQMKFNAVKNDVGKLTITDGVITSRRSGAPELVAGHRQGRHAQRRRVYVGDAGCARWL